MDADPTVSAVVQLASGPDREAAGAPVLHDNQVTAKVKSYFTKAGFEVHAPFTMSFSIGAKRSKFESAFGDTIVVEEDLAASVTLEGGGTELSREPLPEDVRPLVKSITFVPPPDFASNLG